MFLIFMCSIVKLWTNKYYSNDLNSSVNGIEFSHSLLLQSKIPLHQVLQGHEAKSVLNISLLSRERFIFGNLTKER